MSHFRNPPIYWPIFFADSRICPVFNVTIVSPILRSCNSRGLDSIMRKRCQGTVKSCAVRVRKLPNSEDFWGILVQVRLHFNVSSLSGLLSEIRSWQTAHISGDSTRTNLKAKTRQLRLDSALSPQGILPNHTANELAKFDFDLPASRSGA